MQIKRSAANIGCKCNAAPWMWMRDAGCCPQQLAPLVQILTVCSSMMSATLFVHYPCRWLASNARFQATSWLHARDASHDFIDCQPNDLRQLYPIESSQQCKHSFMKNNTGNASPNSVESRPWQLTPVRASRTTCVCISHTCTH